MKLKLITFTLFALSLTAIAEEKALNITETVNEKIKELEKNVVRLPIQNMYYAQNEKGTFVFSEGGRFIFQGKLLDGWQRKEIKSITDARSTLIVPLVTMGIQPELLGSLNTKDDQEIDLLVFTDPNCKACQALYENLNDELGDKYNISYVLTNIIGGDKSTEDIKRLYCNEDKQQALDFLLAATHKELPNMKGDQCDYSRLFTNLAAVQMLGINRLPTLVKPNGEISRGIPIDLEGFVIGELDD